jgi:5'-nucleotidase
VNILITNDDGISSPSLRILNDYVSSLDVVQKVFVVAPLLEQSGVGHAFTLLKPFACAKQKAWSVPAYAVSGTPADCVKFADVELLKNEKIDLVISGINNGSNAGVAALYSGTVAAAREACLWGVRSLALSAPNIRRANVEPILEWLGDLLKSGDWLSITPTKLWNVNTPDVNTLENNEYKGVKFCKMGLVMYQDAYIQDEESEKWMLKGKKSTVPQEDTDDYWLEQGFMTIVPLKIEQTDSSELLVLKKKFEK